MSLLLFSAIALLSVQGLNGQLGGLFGGGGSGSGSGSASTSVSGSGSAGLGGLLGGGGSGNAGLGGLLGGGGSGNAGLGGTLSGATKTVGGLTGGLSGGGGGLTGGVTNIAGGVTDGLTGNGLGGLTSGVTNTAGGLTGGLTGNGGGLGGVTNTVSGLTGGLSGNGGGLSGVTHTVGGLTGGLSGNGGGLSSVTNTVGGLTGGLSGNGGGLGGVTNTVSGLTGGLTGNGGLLNNLGGLTGFGGDSDSGSGAIVNGLVNSGVSAQSIGSFLYSDNAVLSYSSVDQGNALIRALLSAYQAVLGPLGVNNVKIVPVSLNAISTGVNQLAFKVTGTATQAIDVSSVLGQLQGVVSKGSVNNVVAVASGFANSAGGVLQSGSVFTLLDSAALTFSSVTERDALLQSILSLFQSLFGSFGLSNLIINPVGQIADSNGILYQISGISSGALDVSSLVSSLNGAISSSGLSGVTFNVINSASGIGSGANSLGLNSLLLGGSSSNGNGQSNSPVVNVVSQSIGNFVYSDNALLSYTSVNQGNALVQALLVALQAVLGPLGVNNLNIVPVSVTSVSSGVNQLAFKVTGVASKAIDIQSVLVQLQAVISRGSVSGVSALASGFANSAGGVIQSGSVFTLLDSAALSFSSIAQRDSLLQAILNLFQSTFAAAGLSGLSINFVGQANGNNAVLYQISGSASGSWDVSSVVTSFNGAISKAGLSGVSFNVINSATGSAVASSTNSLGLGGGLLGVASGIVNTIGRTAGGLIGAAFGTIAPKAVNQGAITGAGGQVTGTSAGGGLLNNVGGLGGGLIGSAWQAVVPNSVREGSVAGAKLAGNTR